MNIIRIKWQPFPEPTFFSADESIEHARKSQRSRQADFDSNQISGDIIVDGCWTSKQMTIGLSSGRSLLVEVRGSVVDYAIRHGDTQGVSTKEDHLPLLLKHETIDQKNVIEEVWDRSSIFRKRTGKSIELLSATESWIFLYVTGCPPLQFSCLVASEDDSKILYWNDSQ